MNRGDIRWYTFRPPDKRRPVLLLSRDEVLDSLGEMIVAPATRNIRGLGTEVLLTEDDGMMVTCALNFDHVGIAQKGRLGACICTLPTTRWTDVRSALLLACGFAPD